MSKKTFKINNTLYPTEYVQDAIIAFDGYGIIYENEAITIDDENPQYVFDELMNYILSTSLENTIWV